MKVDIVVGLPGLEPGTSSLSGRCDTFQQCSEHCKLPANERILMQILFWGLQHIRSGCCTVAAHSVPRFTQTCTFPQYILHNPFFSQEVRGPKHVKQYITVSRHAFLDITYIIEDRSAKGVRF
jgi:hypothetical protein